MQEQWKHLQQIAWVVFKVRVVDDGKLAISALDAAPHSCTFALIVLMAKENPFKFLLRIRGQFVLETIDDGRSVVGGAVVNHDHLHAFQHGRFRKNAETEKAGANEILLVEDRHNYRKRRTSRATIGLRAVIAQVAVNVRHGKSVHILYWEFAPRRGVRNPADQRSFNAGNTAFSDPQ